MYQIMHWALLLQTRQKWFLPSPSLGITDQKSWLIRKDPDAGRLKVGGEGDNRGWDGWMASPTQWTWVQVNSGSWWWPGRPGVLQCMGLQRVRHDWATELNWTDQKSVRYVIVQSVLEWWKDNEFNYRYSISHNCLLTAYRVAGTALHEGTQLEDKTHFVLRFIHLGLFFFLSWRFFWFI